MVTSTGNLIHTTSRVSKGTTAQNSIKIQAKYTRTAGDLNKYLSRIYKDILGFLCERPL